MEDNLACSFFWGWQVQFLLIKNNGFSICVFSNPGKPSEGRQFVVTRTISEASSDLRLVTNCHSNQLKLQLFRLCPPHLLVHLVLVGFRFQLPGQRWQVYWHIVKVTVRPAPLPILFCQAEILHRWHCTLLQKMAKGWRVNFTWFFSEKAISYLDLPDM